MVEDGIKYAGAWQEISARVQARDHVLLSFMALVAGLVGFSLSRPELGFLAVGVGYLALATALLTRHHDLIIGHLAKFQEELVGETTASREWTSVRYKGSVYAARALRDWAQILFILFGAVSSLYIAKDHLDDPLAIATLLWYGSMICFGGAVVLIIMTQRERHAMAGV